MAAADPSKLPLSAFLQISPKINSQSIEDTQIEYISQKYTKDKYT